MNSLYIKDFRFGLDTRKSELTQKPGSLEVLNNGFVNQGGEIENRKAFVRTARVANTFGLQATAAGLYTFGSITAPGAHTAPGLNIGTGPIPIYVLYQRLQHPAVLFDVALYNAALHDMFAVTFSTQFRGKAVVTAVFDDGKTFLYYDGSLVRDFTDGLLMTHLSSTTLLADEIEDMIDRTTDYTATKPSATTVEITGPLGSAYSIDIAKTTAIGTLTGVVTSDPTNGVAAKRALGSFQVIAGSYSAGVNEIQNIEVGPSGGTFTTIMTASDVDWTNSNEFTAALLSANINLAASAGYTAEANGNTVTILAPVADGDATNNYVVKVTCAGNVCIGKVQFQIQSATSFNITALMINGVDQLIDTAGANSPVTVTNIATAASDIATLINANTIAGQVRGYVANATGAVISISKAVTRSDDVDLPVYFISNAAANSGNGVFEVNGGGGSVASTVVIIVAGSFVVTNQSGGLAGNPSYSGYWPVSLVVTGGLPPYQSPTWYGGNVEAVSTTQFRIKVSSVSPKPVTPPHVYCEVVDSLLIITRSNTL